MYFIVSGLIRIYHLHENGKELTLAIRTPGEIIGEMALIDNEPRSASADALQDTSTLALSRKDFNLIIKTYPNVGLTLLKILSQRLRENLHHQEMLTFQTLKNRTLHLLKEISANFSDADIPYTHEELSSLVNATQPRVTEALHSLQESQQIKISRKNIHIL